MPSHKLNNDYSDVPKFEDHVKAVVHKLRDNLADILGEVGADPTKPQDMARQLGLNKNLTWKVSHILGESDPYMAIPHIPGKSGLGILVRTLKKNGASAKTLKALRESIDEFERMVEIHAGDRTHLEMMLDSLTHDGEQQRHENHRKLSFLGNSATWGVQARVQLTVNFIAPSQSPDMVDLAWLSGLINFRRLRPDVNWAMASARKSVDDGSLLPLGAIEPIDANFNGSDQAPLMGEYCTDPLPEIRTVSGPESMLRYELMEGPVGNTAAVSCIIGLHGKGFVRRYRCEDDSIGEHIARMSTPVEVLVHDLFVHEELSHAFNPEICLYSQLPGGPMYPMSGRNQGRLPLHEKVIDLGRGTSGLMTLEVPRYKLMLQSVYERLGWDEGKFHGFRFKMRYPPIPSLAVLRYDLPEPPKG